MEEKAIQNVIDKVLAYEHLMFKKDLSQEEILNLYFLYKEYIESFSQAIESGIPEENLIRKVKPKVKQMDKEEEKTFYINLKKIVMLLSTSSGQGQN